MGVVDTCATNLQCSGMPYSPLDIITSLLRVSNLTLS